MTTSHRIGPFFGAYGPHGKLVRIWPFDPRPEDIFVCSIARGAAGESRFVNQTLGFWPVASHSVECSFVPHADGTTKTPEEQFECLMHDASEAILRDFPRPVKKSPEMETYRRVEHGLMATAAKRFRMAEEFWKKPHVKDADMLVYRTEVRDLRQPRSWESTLPEDEGPMLPYKLYPTTPISAELRFLWRFIELAEATGRHEDAEEARAALAQVPPDPIALVGGRLAALTRAVESVLDHRDGVRLTTVTSLFDWLDALEDGERPHPDDVDAMKDGLTAIEENLRAALKAAKGET